MSMKPILFDTDMVRAILDGRKTVTRRVVKDKDIINAWDCEADGTPIAYIDQLTGDHYPPTAPCYYQSGDLLYVRETWAEDSNGYVYKADFDGSTGWGWRPSIHMPKEAARIFLRVTGVRVERLQNISSDGINAEGTRGRFGATRGAFEILWDSTIKPADLALYGWTANPWVWVIEFERISRDEALR